MKNRIKKWIAIGLTLAVVLTGSSAAWAQNGAAGGELVAMGYTVDRSVITKGTSVSFSIRLKHTGKTSVDESQVDVSRLVDSFSGGKIDKAVTSGEGQTFTMDVSVSGAVYSGSGRSLKLMVGIQGDYEQIEIPIAECKEYEEPAVTPVEPSQPEPLPAPGAIISRNEMPSSMKAKEERMITVYVKNTGSVTMNSPVITFTASDCLILPGASSSLQLKNIAPGKTESVSILVRAMENVTSSSQYLDAELKFEYYNRVATVDGSCSGRITIPSKVTPEKKPEEKEEIVTDSPVPNLIITGFDYGGASVPAGSAFDLHFTFANTSHKLAAENVVVTVEGGEGFTIHGSSNTFYFEKIKARGKKTVTIPMKVLSTVTAGAQPLSVTFKYEYVDHKKRNTATEDLKITVPVYQKDRFEITRPEAPAIAYAGEETSVSMNYVNKGKTDILNVEATLEGDVDTYTPVQNIGNLESGKSGTITFAVTPYEAGETSFTIHVTYEDADGNATTREFPVTMTVEEMEPMDPGMDEPEPEPEPENKGPGLPVILGIAAAVLLAAVLILRRRKKAAALKKEEEMWSSWDDDMAAGASVGTTGSAPGGSSAGQEEKK